MVNIQDVKHRNFLLLNNGNSINEVCKVLGVNFEKNSLHISVISNGSELDVAPMNLDGILFSEEILDKLDFTKDASFRVYALPDNGAYVKFYSEGHDLIVRNVGGAWNLVLENPAAHYGCEYKPIPYLHLFQNYVWKWWGLDTSLLY